MPRNGPGGARPKFPFFSIFFWSPKWPRIVPPGPGGPWGVFSAYFPAIFGPPGAQFPPPPPIFPYFPILGIIPISCAVGSTSGALYTGLPLRAQNRNSQMYGYSVGTCCNNMRSVTRYVKVAWFGQILSRHCLSAHCTQEGNQCKVHRRCSPQRS